MRREGFRGQPDQNEPKHEAFWLRLISRVTAILPMESVLQVQRRLADQPKA